MKVETVYRTKSRRRTAANEAVVIHCSDHRFQGAFHEFLTEGLNLRTYALLAIPGGGHFASAEMYMPKFVKVGMQNLGFLVKRTGARRLVIFGHDDCLFFKEQLEFLYADGELDQKQFANLVKARSVFRERFPKVGVEIYFADGLGEDSIQFLRID
jgi:hypothetical protein